MFQVVNDDIAQSVVRVDSSLLCGLIPVLGVALMDESACPSPKPGLAVKERLLVVP